MGKRRANARIGGSKVVITKNGYFDTLYLDVHYHKEESYVLYAEFEQGDAATIVLSDEKKLMMKSLERLLKT